MRIIAGTAKGTRLVRVPAGTRPMTDRAREGLFSSLGDRVCGARVLDLYAGSGAVGIEALSRGAGRAVFVDRARGAAEAVESNLLRAKLADRAVVVRSTVDSFLSGKAEPFDLVVLDAPYRTTAGELEEVFGLLRAGWLAPGWTVVVSRPTKGSPPETPLDWQMTKHLRYGDTQVYVYGEA